MRVTSGRPVIGEIDGLRWLSITAVVLSHFGLQLARSSGYNENFTYSHGFALFIELCGNGVSIFFCISAFILALPFIEQYLYNGPKIRLGHYYLRRLTRLEPPYLLVLTLFLAVQILAMHQSWRHLLPHYISSFFYTHNFIYDRRSTINPVAWTLEIEIQFYLLLPLLVRVFTITRAWLRRGILLLVVLAGAVTYTCYDAFSARHHFELHAIGYLPVFSMGFLMADVYLQATRSANGFWQRWWLSPRHVLYDVAGVTGFLLIVYYNGDDRNFVLLAVYAAYALLFAAAFKGRLLQWLFTRTGIMLTGTMCYSIYLLHYAIIAFLMEHVTAQWLSYDYYRDFFVQLLLVLPVVYILCGGFYALVEKPCMNNAWPQRLWHWLKSKKG
jgi:peptidoglycan/LPS O-acetylase OafA/YrhL